MWLNPKPKPPMPGGEFTFVVDTGPQPVPPGVRTVNLIPVGDGGPGPLLPRVTRRPKRKPLLPSMEEIAKLPRWARVAFAARCARRVLPALRPECSPPAAHDQLEVVRAAIAGAEQAAATARGTPITAAADVAGLNVADAAVGAAYAAAVHAADTTTPAYANTAAWCAAHAILRTSADPHDLLFIRRDFERFRWLAKKHGWTDDTPVSPDAVGPLWPPGRVPKWAREKNEPRE